MKGLGKPFIKHQKKFLPGTFFFYSLIKVISVPKMPVYKIFLSNRINFKCISLPFFDNHKHFPQPTDSFSTREALPGDTQSRNHAIFFLVFTHSSTKRNFMQKWSEIGHFAQSCRFYFRFTHSRSKMVRGNFPMPTYGDVPQLGVCFLCLTIRIFGSIS